MTPNTLRYEDTRLDEETWKELKKELNETRENRKKGVEALRKKLTAVEDLVPCLNEDFLLSFLRVTKFNPTKAFERILNYYDVRYRFGISISNYLPSSVRIAEKARQIYLCPYRLPDNSAVIIQKRTEYDPSEIPFEMLVQVAFMAADCLLQHPLTSTSGMTVVLDLSSNLRTPWNEYTPSRLKLIAKAYQKSLAVRFKSIHIVNAPTIFHFLYSMIYPFLSAKMRNRVYLHKDHNNWTTLHEHISPEHLPEEYGGYLDHLDLINVYDRMNKMEDHFKKIAHYGFLRK